MKKILMLIFVTSLVSADISPDPQKFEVTFTITYNTMTLQEAADMEAKLRLRHKGACTFETAIEGVGNITAYDDNDEIIDTGDWGDITIGDHQIINELDLYDGGTEIDVNCIAEKIIEKLDWQTEGIEGLKEFKETEQ